VYRSGTDTEQPGAKCSGLPEYGPLAGAPGFGEINGLGQGLHAWFGVSLEEVRGALRRPTTTPDKVQAFKQTLTLLAAVRAPSYYLHQNQAALETGFSITSG
jgi:hypothetical protein